MEESAQILEIETFIPLLLQEPEDGHNRFTFLSLTNLKRFIDHRMFTILTARIPACSRALL